jgi:hypothetical protein
MILVYLSLLLFFGLLRVLIAVRVRLLERKYARAAAEAQALLQQPAYRDGNSRHADPYKSAKQQFVLGSLVQKRDRAEARYAAWQARSDKLGQGVRRLRAWKGRLVPYLLGVIDVALLLGVLSALGLADSLQLSKVLERVSAIWRG